MTTGATYPSQIQDPSGKVIWGGSIVYTDSASQPSPSTPPITSGTLPATAAWVSGTAKVNPVARAITVAVEVVTDGTNNIATCAIAISPDNTTYTTLGTPGAVAAQNNAGVTTTLVNVPLPQGWYIKLTLAHVTVAASFYY
jgi:hypothetical protein